MAQRALGTTLEVGIYTVGGLTSLSGVELTADSIDVTTFDSVDGYRKYIGGFNDGNEVVAEGYLSDKGSTEAGLAALIGGAEQDCIITFPTGASWMFKGVVSSFSTSADLEDPLAFSISIKVSGHPVFAATASAGLTAPFFAVSGAGTVITPAPAGNKYEYVVNVANAVASVTITPTAAAGTIKVDGVTVASGAASGAIALTAGAIKDVKIVVSETNKAPKVYLLHIVRIA